MSVERLEDWDFRLAEHIASTRRPFVAHHAQPAANFMSVLGRDVHASRATRFAVLDKRPPAVRRRPGESKAQFIQRGLAEDESHRRRMVLLLLERYGIAPSDPRATGELLAAVLRDSVPAFAERDRRGRPRTAINEAQVRAIHRAVAAGESLRSACLGLVTGTGKLKKRRADALAKAYVRETKKR